MREKLIERIMNMYVKGLYDDAYPLCGSNPDIAAYSHFLNAKTKSAKSFREYLNDLSEDGLIGAFESQCCQKYR